jgi:hypothetical protein
MFNRGGQRRTIQAPCGWIRKGHPNEVNKLFILHKKYCKSCGEIEFEATEFNKEAGNMNGWKGSKIPNQPQNQIQTTCIVDGKVLEVISEAKSIDQAARVLHRGEYDTIVSVAPTNDKKKKKKGKKNAKPTISINVEV